jgi:hypothetical protein
MRRSILWLSLMLAALLFLAAPAAAQTTQPENVVCPNVPGYEATFDYEVPINFNSFVGGYDVNCWYQSLSVDADGAITESELILNAYWAPPDGDEKVAQWAPDSVGLDTTYCSDIDELTGGLGIVASDERAVRGTYTFREFYKPFDAVVGAEAVRTLRELVKPFARSCAGAEIIPRSAYFTPLPPYIADALEAAGASSPEPPAATSPPTSTAPAATAPVTTEADAAVAPSPGSGSSGSEGSSGMRALGFVFLGLSVVGLLWALRRAGKERRVRPRLDAIRILLIAGTAIGTMMVLANTPAWAVVGGVVLGAVLGWLQGRNVSIFFKGTRVYEKRNVVAIGAFAVGLVVSQGAGLLNRKGMIGIGVGVTFLSAATAAGLLAGRRKPLAAAGSGGAATMLVAGLFAALVLPLAAVAMAQEQPTEEERRAAITADLTEAVAWESIEITGGLFPQTQKPFAIIPVSPGLVEAPEPLTRTIEWEDANGSSFEVTETFTFDLNADSVCCTVGYEGDGSESFGQITNELTASGILGDFVSPTDMPVNRLGAPTVEWGVPFGEAEDIWTGGDEPICRRPVAEQPRGNEGEWSTLERNGEPIDWVSPSFAMYTQCEIDGFDAQAALAALPPVPASSASEREARGFGTTIPGCPVFQESFGALYDPSMGSAPTNDLQRMFMAPNTSACSDFVNIGQEGRGGTRSEVAYDLVTPDPKTEGLRQFNIADAMISALPLHQISKDNQCAIGTDGVALAPAGDGETCQFRSWHDLGEGVITIFTDYDFVDGPNVFVRGDFPWGSYDYRCHHCDPSSPEVARIVAAMDVFGNTGLGNFGPKGEVVGTVGVPDDKVGEKTDAGVSAREDLIDLLADDPSDPFERAAIAAAIGLVGTIGIATVEEILGRKEEDDEAIPPPLLDENGEPMVVSDGVTLDANGEVVPEGLVKWVDGYGDETWISREEAVDRVSAEKAARAADEEWRRERAQDAETTWMDNEREAATKKREAAANAEAELLSSQASHREKVWDWFEAHPEYGHLWERVINADGSVDTDLMRRIAQHAQRAGIELPEISLLEDFVATTASEIFTGQRADGSISWEAMILRGLVGLATAGQSEWAWTPGDALVRMKEAIDNGDMRDWNEIASDAAARAVFDEWFGRVIGRGIELGAGGLTKLFPGLTRDAAEVLEEIMEKLRRPVGGAAPRPITPDLDVFRRRINDALKSGDDEAMRGIFAGGGMKRMAELEAAGHLTAAQAKQIVDFHDALTRQAIHQGTRNAIAEWDPGLPPIKEVYVGNSGSVGPHRSVKTDADRTIVLVFDETQLTNYAKRQGLDVDTAHDILQQRFSDFQAQRTAAALNPADSIPLDATRDMDIANYAGIGPGSGQLDSYPTQYTRTRMQVMGETDVYRVTEGGVTRTRTSGDAIVDQMDLNANRLGNGLPADQYRIPPEEMTMLHNQQMTAIRTSTDVKSVAKAVDRELKIASQLQQPMPDEQLVQMAREIRATPTSTNEILHNYGYSTEDEAVDALRQMMEQYDASVQLPHFP